VHLLTEGLVGRGHEVTLFASGDSQTGGRLSAVHPVSSFADPAIGVARHEEYEVALIESAWTMAKSGCFDVLHSHSRRGVRYLAPLPCAGLCTLRDPLHPLPAELVGFESRNYVALSEAQRRLAPQLNWIATVHNGIETERIPFSDEKQDYVVFAGRIDPQKGTDYAIRAAIAADIKLVIAGLYPSHLRERGDPRYVEWVDHSILPFRDHPNIEFAGFLEQHELWDRLARARALLFPIRGHEAFGNVMIEALACGTPVIGFDFGSTSEVVHHGRTGLLVTRSGDDDHDVHQLAAAIQRAGELSTFECRVEAESRFCLSRVVDRYEEVYDSLVHTVPKTRYRANGAAAGKLPSKTRAADLGAIFDEVARYYDDAFQYRSIGADQLSAVSHAEMTLVETLIGRALGLATADRAVDIGCGTGRALDLVRARSPRAIGIDLSPGMLRHCRTKHAGAMLCVGDMLRLPFPAAAFDIATCVGVFDYYDADEIGSALREVKRILKGDGYLIVSFTNKMSLYAEAYVSSTEEELRSCLRAFSPDEASGLIESAGFRIVDCGEAGTHVQFLMQSTHA
jgi:glycosyltransferase involved in cell wall biosynthesis/ubiquinone/menaquinone biosynthesis C-methylase UbiE